MINDQIKLTGELQVVLKDSNGNIKEQKTIPNLVVTTGKVVIASRLTGTSTSVMTHMALGTGTATPIAANTTLTTEISGARVALTTSGGIAAANVVTFSAIFGPGVGTGAVTEAGIFNASSAGSMLCKTVFSVVNKDVGDTLTINWAVTIS
jgi:hypothetical protein